MSFLESPGLARISHQLPTAAPHLPASAALRSVGVLDGPTGPPARASVATPCSRRHLRRLATKAGEKCGLASAGGNLRRFGSHRCRLSGHTDPVHRQVDGHTGAAPFRTVDADPPVVALDGLLDEGQPEAGTCG